MTVIGITGPSGSGKGLASSILSEYGFYIIDADKVYSEIITPPSECLDELADAFGISVILPDGGLDRKALARIVFDKKNSDKLLLLNLITHKYVTERIKNEISSLSDSEYTACVIDAPLLIEADICKDCDITLAIIADKDERIKRIISRDGISPEEAVKRINSQKSDDFYIVNTDYVIYNNGDSVLLRENLNKIILNAGGIGHGE